MCVCLRYCTEEHEAEVEGAEELGEREPVAVEREELLEPEPLLQERFGPVVVAASVHHDALSARPNECATLLYSTTLHSTSVHSTHHNYELSSSIPTHYSYSL